MQEQAKLWSWWPWAILRPVLVWLARKAWSPLAAGECELALRAAEAGFALEPIDFARMGPSRRPLVRLETLYRCGHIAAEMTIDGFCPRCRRPVLPRVVVSRLDWSGGTPQHASPPYVGGVWVGDLPVYEPDSADHGAGWHELPAVSDLVEDAGGSDAWLDGDPDGAVVRDLQLALADELGEAAFDLAQSIERQQDQSKVAAVRELQIRLLRAQRIAAELEAELRDGMVA
jgi:hypothetical protein